ncbi:hypothetical protein [Nannocystis bainbridge]|uniref:WD40 repeat domain-containing protein n=1 Tax=Nannocystis bainbridge TaxID=2995303 RepID=A0ABT5DV86_9BACT|nr:hypothetical protein [Nannocystis bainbridge]MDC0717486.1 hypothetical protein [Nannocystis bainbridge]
MLVVFAGLGGQRSAAPSTASIQLAVLAEGFGLLHGDAGARRFVEFAPDGTQRRELSLDLDADARLVGTRLGAALGWKDGKKVRLAAFDDRGRLTDPSTWGKSVQRLCDGAATGDGRFAVGWIEQDGKVWFVHGPMAQAIAFEAPHAADIEPLRADWCGIASAEHNIALMWKGKHTYINFCGPRECSSLVARIQIDARERVLSFGCLRDSCLVGTRDDRGISRVHLVTPLGKIAWSRTLAPGDGGALTIVGAGDRAFLVAAADGDGSQVLRFETTGKSTPVWQRRGASVPSLAWSRGRLALAHAEAGGVRNEFVTVPR